MLNLNKKHHQQGGNKMQNLRTFCVCAIAAGALAISAGTAQAAA
jgi:hypothetical protein